MKKNVHKKGFMVIEVLMAVSIITASILATMAVAEKSVRVSKQSLHSFQAAYLLEEGAEAVRVVRDNGWTNITGMSLATDYYPTFGGGTWTLSATPNIVGNFIRVVRVESVNRDNTTKDISSLGTLDPDTKLVTVNVSWTEGGTAVSKSLQFYIMNIF